MAFKNEIINKDIKEQMGILKNFFSQNRTDDNELEEIIVRFMSKSYDIGYIDGCYSTVDKMNQN